MYSVLESEITIRPADIDMNNHVHSTKYLDYVLSAHYEQMLYHYKIGLIEYNNLDYTWVIRTSHSDYIRAISLHDKILVRTQIDFVNGAQSKVNFWIIKKENNKIAAEGYLVYTMVSLKNGRPIRIPDSIVEKYSTV